MARRGTYTDWILHREESSRYRFHHSPRHGLHRGPDPDGLQISITDERTMERVTYRVFNANRFPLRELMYTFAEQVGVRLEHLEFRYKGAALALDATPESIGITQETDIVFTVSTTRSAHGKRVEHFTTLNQMGKVLVRAGPHQSDVFDSNLLPLILEYAGLEALVNCSQVCRHWFHVSQRFSVLVQLQDGDSGSWQQGQKYPLLLHDGCRHSFNLALCQAFEADGKQLTKWDSTLMEKERNDNQAFGYCKAAGCILVKSVYMSTITRDLESKWEALNNAKTAFMNQVENAHVPPGSASSMESNEPQEFPPQGNAADGFIAEARDWRYKNCAVELYRRYFSPDMHYIFPLIVNKQAAVGLDFSSCTTSLIFGAPSNNAVARDGARPRRIVGRWRNQRTLPPPVDGGVPSPLGSVSWRIHDAGKIAAKGMGCADNGGADISSNPPSLQMVNGSRPQIILEVLFIAVWETDRGGEYGSSLVAALASFASRYAMSQGQKSALLYVEIGFEQPKAKMFWSNNGLSPVVRKEQQAHNQEDVLMGRVLELENWQLGFIDRRCLRFKDTEQYAKRILVG